MKATLSLEYFGEAEDSRLFLYSKMCDQVIPGLGKEVTGKTRLRKPWVAKIKGICDKFGFEREFLNGKIDYSQSNSKGSRGVRIWYILESDSIYEIFCFNSWRSSRRYFCEVKEDGLINMLSKEEVISCLKDI